MERTWLKTQVRLEPRYTELVGARMPLCWLEGTAACRWVDMEQRGGRLVCRNRGIDYGGKGYHRCEDSSHGAQTVAEEQDPGMKGTGGCWFRPAGGDSGCARLRYTL